MNNKFFHPIATRNSRHSYISCFPADDGSEVTSHEEKVVVLWNAFKNRLGQSSEINIQI
jgi:hypothetical protein